MIEKSTLEAELQQEKKKSAQIASELQSSQENVERLQKTTTGQEKELALLKRRVEAQKIRNESIQRTEQLTTQPNAASTSKNLLGSGEPIKTAVDHISELTAKLDGLALQVTDKSNRYEQLRASSSAEIARKEEEIKQLEEAKTQVKQSLDTLQMSSTAETARKEEQIRQLEEAKTQVEQNLAKLQTSSTAEIAKKEGQIRDLEEAKTKAEHDLARLQTEHKQFKESSEEARLKMLEEQADEEEANAQKFLALETRTVQFQQTVQDLLQQQIQVTQANLRSPQRNLPPSASSRVSPPSSPPINRKSAAAAAPLPVLANVGVDVARPQPFLPSALPATPPVVGSSSSTSSTAGATAGSTRATAATAGITGAAAAVRRSSGIVKK